MRTPVISASLKKTNIDDLYEVSTVDARDVGLGFETVAFKIEARFPFRFQLMRANSDTIDTALVDHENMCEKYEMKDPKPAEAYGTRNAVTIIHITPEELLRIAYAFARERDRAKGDHASIKLSDSVVLMTKPIKLSEIPPTVPVFGL